MFETAMIEYAEYCDRHKRDIHEHALVSHAKSDDNQENEEYDWSEKSDYVSVQNDFVPAKEIKKKNKQSSNLSKIVAKQDETIAQLTSELEKLKSEKDVNSSYVEMPDHVREKMCTKECYALVEHYRNHSFQIASKLKKEELWHNKLKEQHSTSDQRITSLQESLKKSEREAANIKSEAAKSIEHLSSVIKDLQEEISKMKKLSKKVNSENNSLKTKLQEEQEKFTSLQEDHKLCEDRFKSLTQSVDSMLSEKHNLNVQLMELTDKLNRSQSDLVFIKEEVEQAKPSEPENERLVPAEIGGSQSSQEEKTEEVQKRKKKKVRRKKSKAKKNKTKAASSDSTPQPPSTAKSQDSESPSDSNSDVYCLICDSETHHISDCIYNQGVFPYGSKGNKFKTPASSIKPQQVSTVKASQRQQESKVKASQNQQDSTAKATQKKRMKNPFKAHQKYCEICEMYNHKTSECCYNKYCAICQMYKHDTTECYYNKYCSICDMVNHNTSACIYNRRSTMKPRRYVQRNSSSRYVSNFKFINGDHLSNSWKPRSVRKQNQTNPFLHKQNSQQNQFLKNRFRNDYNRSSKNSPRHVKKPKQSFGSTQKQLWRKIHVKEDDQRDSSIDGPPEDAIYQQVTYIDEFGQSKTGMAWISPSN